jgi:cell division protein FtsL
VTPRPRRNPRRRGVAGVMGAVILLLAALALVTWRQTEGVAREHALRELQAERTIAEAERMELERRIQALSTRVRVVRVARERLGMHLPDDGEIMLLPLPADSVAAFTAARGRE